MSGFTSYAERIDAQKIRERSPSFFDHFQPGDLLLQQPDRTEKNHIIRALRFELGKVETPPIRERMLGLLAQVDKGLASSVAEGLGATVPRKAGQANEHEFSGGCRSEEVSTQTQLRKTIEASPALSDDRQSELSERLHQDSQDRGAACRWV